jgi:hypothetical protein
MKRPGFRAAEKARVGHELGMSQTCNNCYKFGDMES